MNPNRRNLVITGIVILLMTVNFTRLKGSDCLRPIHIFSLLALGAAIGVMLVYIFMLIKNRKN